MTSIHIRDLSKAFPGRPPVQALDGVDIDIDSGTLIAVLGPSGCGKTTLLRLIAGFERPDSGAIHFGDELVASRDRSVPPERRNIGIVPQEGALFPHLDVAGNVGFPLRERRSAAGRARVDELLELVGLSGLGRRRPHELSGGQQQRVALARALASRPSIVLLDEPFTALDVTLRARLRNEIADILRRQAVTALMVTHDPEEAMGMADVVAVMRSGRIGQVAASAAIYRRPHDLDTAALLGEVTGLIGIATGARAATALGEVDIEPGVDGPVRILLRPEQVVADDDPAAVKATVVNVEYHGHDGLVELRLGTERVTGRWPAFDLPLPGATVGVRLVGAPLLAVALEP